MTHNEQPSDAVEAFLHELGQWEQAYPLSAFPEPNLGIAAKVLKEAGMTLDAISASNMRHVVSCIAPKAREAVAQARKEGAAEMQERCEKAIGIRSIPAGVMAEHGNTERARWLGEALSEQYTACIEAIRNLGDAA